MKSTLVLSILASIATAQIQILQFGTGDLPSCAQTCPTLLNAQTVCIPPGAPVTNVQTYKSCFCQSGYLNTLASDASTICDTTCTSQTDRTQIQSWYASYCANANDLPEGVAVASTSTLPATAAATSAGAASTTASGSQATSTSASGAVPATPVNQTWWQSHSRWIAMVIVLIVGFALLTFLLLFIRRRYRRKHYGLGNEAPPLVWGPHQNQHATGGVMYPGGVDAGNVAADRQGARPAYNEKGKANASTQPRQASGRGQQAPARQMQQTGPQDPEKGSKLKKFIGR